MKTFALALCALVVLAGAAPIALAQGSSPSSPPAAAPSVGTPSSPPPDASRTPSSKTDVDIKASKDTGTSADVDKDREGGLASPRTGDAQRTGFFGLSPTAAIIVSVAVLLVVILAIVAMTHSGGSTYIDTDRRV